MSEYYGVSTPSSDFLAHYGVKGMKWGVRKFAKDKYASPSGVFRDLYGSRTRKGNVKPRAMQRHFNQLDKSYTNIRAKQSAKEIEFNDLLHARKRVARKNNEKALKKIDKALGETMNKGVQYATQNRNIERMMDAVAAKAVNSGYTVKSKPVLRFKYTMVKGRGIGVQPVGGQRVKIRKAGDGQAVFTMYEKKDRKSRGKPKPVNLTAAYYGFKSR